MVCLLDAQMWPRSRRLGLEAVSRPIQDLDSSRMDWQNASVSVSELTVSVLVTVSDS